MRRLISKYHYFCSLCLIPLLGCGPSALDRLDFPPPQEGEGEFISLSVLPLRSDADFDRLDKWLSEHGGLEATLRVYDDLSRLAPENIKVHVRAALAVMAYSQERGRALGEAVLSRFADKISKDPDLTMLANRIGPKGGEGDESSGPEASP